MKFADVLRQYRVPIFTEGRYCRPGWVQFHCPFCYGGRDPNKPYAGYNVSKHYVNCWRCGGHPVGRTLMTLTGLTWSEVRNLVDDLERPRREERELAGRLVLPDELGPLLLAHKRYLRDVRGFKLSALNRWQLQGIGVAARLSWRVFIPIHYRGRIVSWTTRSITEKEPRYVSASEQQEAMPHKTLLYGEDFAGSAISIHEGPLDVWRVGPGAVATLGTGWTAAQVLRMSKYARRIVCFDNEKAAQQRARKLCDLLEPFSGETFNVVLDAKDADESSETELTELRSLLA